MRGEELREHLDGFQGFVRHHAGPAVGELQGLIDEIGATELAIGCVIEPDFDAQNVAKSFLVSLACTYEKCLMFYEGAILSPFGEVWFGPPDAEPFANISELSVHNDLIFERAEDPTAFINDASMRSKKSILDAAQLVIQIHSAIRSAMTGGELIPDNLNWTRPGNMVPVTSCPAIGVVAERHFTLNWLLQFDGDEWDDVDTPTVPRGILED